MERKYWKGMDELKETSSFLESRDQEFPAQTSVEEFLGDESLEETSTARRDFLKFLGFSVAAATVAACEAPVTKAIPYVNKPENVTPGMATWYASTYYDGAAYASIVVKTREGRPIFIKGNKDQGITQGAVNPRIIASVLGLYDGARLTGPTMQGEVKSYADIDSKIISGLKSASKVVLVSNTVISSSAQTAISELAKSLGDENKFEHIQYDAVSYAGMRAANKESLGLLVNTEDKAGIIPNYDFSKAKTIVSIGADFLNSWLLPTQFTPQYASRRNPDGEWMSKHFQFESNMSITGSNADSRGMIKPSEQANVISYILSKMGVNTGVSTSIADKEAVKVADAAVKALKHSKGESLVVCDSNNKAVQVLVNKLNDILGAYETTINVNNPLNIFMSQDEKMNAFVQDVVNNKSPEAVIFYGVNPAYTLSNGSAFVEGLSKAKITVALSSYADETAANCTYVTPDHHALEGWMDMGITRSHYAIAQPTIRPLHNTASAIESFLVWAGQAKRGGKDSKVAYDYIRGLWEQYGFPTQTEHADFESYWNAVVHNSCDNEAAPAATGVSFNGSALNGLAAQLPKGGAVEVSLYQKAGLGDGSQANNPWLQELPDPMTKATWDNYITMNPVDMLKQDYATTYDEQHGLGLATIKVGSQELTLPVFPLPGQALNTVGVALGYGRGANGENIGKAAFQTKEYGGHVTLENGNPAPIGANAFAHESGIQLPLTMGLLQLQNKKVLTQLQRHKFTKR